MPTQYYGLLITGDNGTQVITSWLAVLHGNQAILATVRQSPPDYLTANIYDTRC